MASSNHTDTLSRVVIDEELAGPITSLMNSYYTPFIISASYILFVHKIGPKMMKNRQPFSIKEIIIIYNMFQVVFNFYLCAKCFQYLYNRKDSFFCLLPETPGSKIYKEVTHLSKLFFMNKTADLLDTIFFVLKKKDSHITFLHLYHHTLTFVGSWFVGNYIPGGVMVFFGFLNAFVHTVMYGYYLISASAIHKSVIAAFKKPVTQLQLVQFAIIGLYGIKAMSDKICISHVPSSMRYLTYFGMSQVVMMVILFTNFYRQAYIKNANKGLAEKQQKMKIRSE